jgi:acyl-CoA dehydrogenase
VIELHAQTLRGILGRREDQSADALWQAASEVGYTTATVPSTLGGGDGSLEDGAAIARAASRALYGAPLGVANVVLGPLLAAASWPVREDLPAVVLRTEPAADVSIVDFGACARAAYVVTARPPGCRMTLLDLNDESVGRRPAGRAEPGHVACIDLVRAAVLDETALDEPYGHWLALGALSSAIEIEGAVDAVLRRTVEYLDTRVQFGRRLMQFQALQHRLADLAARADLLSHAVDEAVRRCSESDVDAQRAVAVAKIEAVEIGRLAVAEAHQLHGAIGYTEESGLGEYSKVVWSQSRRHGSAHWWRAWLGDHDRARDLWNASAPFGTATAAIRNSAGGSTGAIPSSP